jgi:hypothetical protein
MGTLELAGYLNHQNWVCNVASIPQAWPVNTEPTWWCGNVVQKCVCKASDMCH